MEGYWDAGQPGCHHEGYVHALTHGLAMIFNATFDKSGTMQWLSVYSCEGGGRTSIQVLSRAVLPSPELVESYIRAASAIGLDVSGMDLIDYTACKWRSSASG